MQLRGALTPCVGSLLTTEQLNAGTKSVYAVVLGSRADGGRMMSLSRAMKMVLGRIASSAGEDPGIQPPHGYRCAPDEGLQ